MGAVILHLEGKRTSARIVDWIHDRRRQQQLLSRPIHAGQQGDRVNALSLGQVQCKGSRTLVELLVVIGVIVRRARNGAGQHRRDPGVAAGQVVQRLAAVGVLNALTGSDGYALLIATHTYHVAHMAVLALGGMGDIGGTLSLELWVRGCTTLLPVSGEHELREGALHVVVREGGVLFRGQRLRSILAYISQHRIGDIVAGVAEVFALVIAAVEHLVSGRRIGERSALVRIRADKELARPVLGVVC
ncbi:MAG: hypothetical protein PVF74_02185 [Anaerolineales bacterium]